MILTKLWKNKDKNGQTYLSGRLGDAKIFIFPNKYKTEEKQPDYVLTLEPAAPPKDKVQQVQSKGTEPTHQQDAPSWVNEEIPF